MKNEWHKISVRMKQVLGMDAEAFYDKPEAYSGLAAKRATDLAARYRGIAGELREKVKK